MGFTLAEKLLAHAASESNVYAGEYVTASIDLAVSHDNSALVIDRFHELGGNKVRTPEKIVIILDHRTPANTIMSANLQKRVRHFIIDQNIPLFFDVGEGICHQVLFEKRLIAPGMVVVGSDSHMTTHGAVSAFATGVGAIDLAAIWKEGTLWFKVPQTLKFIVQGTLSSFVTAKDISLSIIGKIGAAGASYRSCEFYGTAIKDLSLASRLCLCNMMMEAGAKNAIIPSDENLRFWFNDAKKSRYDVVYADADAMYEKEYIIDVAELVPQIACPHSVDNVKPVSAVHDVAIDQILIGSCTNGRLEDFAIAAEIIGSRKVCNTVRLLLVPASRTVLLNAVKKGYLQRLIKAGGILLPPGCGPCLGLHQGVVADNEIVLSTSNRNFQGRMGAASAQIYLSSPAVAAASAVTGVISDPREVVR
ncbi:MAG: 3-isopropylmalate dehydratase large subunit [Candidatus Thermoplasmatota archaeon]|nr:3-isopropylmalate dehydratase large subunit [Candidatus Thermoplasmatota archaeon]MBU1940787.1 3-isopropylmalate dehydratase large subunit [Candidatus Thermoplasmatota archaeon]